jgi:YrbI family 3-deoxy-D-manno-octulosonate 8-phosphate phosphatase
VLTAIVTRKQTTIVTRRARELDIAEVHQNAHDKATVLRDLLARHRIAAGQACYVGDDVGDLEAMALVGLPVAVPDAIVAVRRAAAYITRAPGGHGAIREICELILAARRPRAR